MPAPRSATIWALLGPEREWLRDGDDAEEQDDDREQDGVDHDLDDETTHAGLLGDRGSMTRLVARPLSLLRGSSGGIGRTGQARLTPGLARLDRADPPVLDAGRLEGAFETRDALRRDRREQAARGLSGRERA